MHGRGRGGDCQRVFRRHRRANERIPDDAGPRARGASWGKSRMMKRVVLVVTLIAIPAVAQWVHVPTPGIPRAKDGKPNLSAPAPRTREGKPDLSGIWVASTGKYLANIAADGI